MMRMRWIHHHELHVLWGLPVTLPLVDEPVVYLLLIQSCWFCKCQLLWFLFIPSCIQLIYTTPQKEKELKIAREKTLAISPTHSLARKQSVAKSLARLNLSLIRNIFLWLICTLVPLTTQNINFHAHNKHYPKKRKPEK